MNNSTCTNRKSTLGSTAEEQKLQDAVAYLLLFSFDHAVKVVDHAISQGKPEMAREIQAAFDVFDAARDVVRVLHADGHDVIQHDTLCGKEIFDLKVQDLCDSLSEESKQAIEREEIDL